MKPKRIQRKRTAGWRMPENTVYVGRGSKWGNPLKVGTEVVKPGTRPIEQRMVTITPALAKTGYRQYLEMKNISVDELRGKNLACWCPLAQPCHADVLLELANE